MEAAALDVEARDYALHLERTQSELRRRLDQYEARIQAIRPPNDNASPSAVSHGRILATALEDAAAESAPFLPAAGSVLPALLALRRTHQAIVDAEAYLAVQAAERERLRERLEADRAALRDQRLLTDALNARLVELRAQLAAEPAAQPDDAAERQLENLAAKKRGYDRETSRLMKVLLAFIDNRLAPLLAAEELGGPVVGDVLDVRLDDLAAGFTAHGKPKRTRPGGGPHDARQRRLDEVWGAGWHGNDEDDVAAAGSDMRQLVEELLNTLVEAKGDTTASYVTLTRESAAARFLVRSKVAQLHPKDAMRLRLVDFGRELGG